MNKHASALITEFECDLLSCGDESSQARIYDEIDEVISALEALWGIQPESEPVAEKGRQP